MDTRRRARVMATEGGEMTREEKINIFVEQILKEEGVSDTWIDGFKDGLSVMYDALSIDFNSRICDKCRWYKDIDKSFKVCKLYGINHGQDYGCNKFEVKE